MHDPVQNRFFSIDNQTRELLSLWNGAATADELATAAEARLGHAPDTAQLQGLAEFLVANGLTETSIRGWRDLADQAESRKHSIFSRAVHGYLFFRVPFLRPNRVLRAALPFVQPLFSWRVAAAIAAIGMLGIYLASRQWNQFQDSLQNLLTIEGAVAFGLCLVVAKALHELGHAFAAVRYGCHVSTMGVAFMVMTPLLYTDVTDAWRLSSRQRIVIDAAGMIVDVAVACIATFLWSFLPEGPFKTVAFVMATTGWLLSLAINLNPLMRFDGYYLLSSLLGIENLQARSFALGRWKLRQILFSPDMVAPEQLSRRMTATLVLYAWSVWIYRLIVFTGIAILVYHYFFKLLGLVLFAVEIWFFIARPILRELLAWKAEAASFAPSRTACTALVAVFMAVVLLVPWFRRIEVPAVFDAQDVIKMFPSRPAQVIEIADVRGRDVAAGDIIATLSSPQLMKEIEVSQIKREAVGQRLSRIGSDRLDRDQSIILNRELLSLNAKLEGLSKEQQELVVRAPIAGHVAQLGENIHVGRWLGKNDLIVLITSRSGTVARGYVAESDVPRLAADTAGRFVPDDLTRSPFPVRVNLVARTGAPQIDILELASSHGGRITVNPDNRQRLVPISGQHQVELQPPEGVLPPEARMRGVVELRGHGESIVTGLWRRAVQVLVRESGF